MYLNKIGESPLVNIDISLYFETVVGKFLRVVVLIDDLLAEVLLLFFS